MKILVINAGSSSIKYSLFEGPQLQCVYHGLIEPEGKNATIGHANALQEIEAVLQQHELLKQLGDCDAIAHRVVHGGETFQEPVIINDRVIQSIDDLSYLAPLHNPVNLQPIKTLAEKYPELIQVAVFDTAFHQTMPDYAYRYALPNEYYHIHQIRRYGFHGSSHQYLAERFAQLKDKPLQEINIITLHLGNGASVCAVSQGESMDTSMGFTPLEGLMMGSRSGDLDPAIPLYMIRQLGIPAEEVDFILNQQSGLLGISGKNDMRSILQLDADKDINASLAIDMFVYRINKIVGSYIAVMDELDAIIFTGGIGEHATPIREKILEGFSLRLRIFIDEEKNETLSSHGNEGVISHSDSETEVWVIPTNEEWQIAQQASKLLNL